MKRLIMLVALMATMSLGVQAQNEIGTMTVQGKGGFGFSTLTNVEHSEMIGVGMFGGELEYGQRETGQPII